MSTRLAAMGKRKEPDLNRLRKIGDLRVIQGYDRQEEFIKKRERIIKKVAKYTYGKRDYKYAFNNAINEIKRLHIQFVAGNYDPNFEQRRKYNG